MTRPPFDFLRFPRFHIRFTVTVAVATVLLFNGPELTAQQTAKPSPAPPPKNAKAPSTKEDPQLQMEKALAQTRLESAGEHARQLDDGIMKAKVLGRLGDTLWNHNQSRARQYFMLAFQTIDAIRLDAKVDQRAAITEQSAPLLDLRSSILALVARHDLKLAEQIRQSLNRSDNNRDKQERKYTDDELERMYLEEAAAAAATQPQQAAEIITKTYSKGPNHQVIGALFVIRQSDPGIADQIFAQLLTIAASRELSAEELEILADYVLPTEADLFYGSDPLKDPTRGTTLGRFLSFVYEALTTRNNIEMDADDATSEYRTLNQLLPFFDRLQPVRSPFIRQTAANLISKMHPSDIQRTVEPADNVDELLRQAESAVGDRRRTIRFMRASSAALNHGDVEKAVDIARRIDDPYERTIQTSLVLFQTAMKALRENEIDRAYKHAQGIDFLPQRVSVLHRLAIRLWDREPDRALMVARELWDWMAKAPNTAQKVEGMLKLTATMAKHDRVRAFEWLQSTVAALNGTDFSYKPPDANRISVEVYVAADMVDLDTSFGLMARLDAERTFSIAQTLTRNDFSLLAQTIVGQQVLERAGKH